MKEPTYKFVEKYSYDTYYDLVLFAFRCPAFTCSIHWRNFLCQFKSCDKTIALPDPDLINNAFLDFGNSGNLEKLYAIPCVSFRGKLSSSVDGIICAEPSVMFYVAQFCKAYSVFYHSFNPKNFIIK